MLTTNALENINPAMLRPGRLDAVIDVLPPDAEAAERLVRVYTGTDLDPTADLLPVGVALEGLIPAVIAEVVKRARLVELARRPVGVRGLTITAEALLSSARSMASQVELLRRRAAEEDAKRFPSDTLDTHMRNLIADVVTDVVDQSDLADWVKNHD